VPPVAVPVKFAVRGADPDDGVADAAAVSRLAGAVTVIVRDLLLVAFELSVTVSVAVLLPASEKVWEGFWVAEVLPSPKLHL